MRLRAQKAGNGCISGYNGFVSTSEARAAGFLREDGSSRHLKKVADKERGTVTLSVDWEAEEAAGERKPETKKEP